MIHPVSPPGPRMLPVVSTPSIRTLLLPIVILSVILSAGLEGRQALRDTAATEAPTKDSTSHDSGIDTLVTYNAADSIVYSIKTRFMHLYGKSETQYRTMGLKAERISVNWDTSVLDAEGVRDRVKKDSTIGRPILRDGGDEYHGSRVGYNFRTKKGKINLAETELEKGYYQGEEIKKVEPDVLYVADGRYTTCDAPHPHYYFYSPRMKIYVRDKVVAEPVIFYVADVPILALPFGVFPSRSGRSSGIITPVYGEDNRGGKYLSHLGYYWAANDYFDVATDFDLFTRGGWLNHSTLRYALRYNFSGQISANISSTHDGEPTDPTYTETRDYHINWTHSQQINPSSRLDVNFTFASGSYFKNFSTSLPEVLQQNIISNATFWKSWETGNRSLTVNVSRDQSLTNGNIREGLPSISFTQGQFFPFRKKTKSRGMSAESGEEAGWPELIALSYSANFSNAHTKESQSVDSIRTVQPDSTRYPSVQDFQNTNAQNLTQGLSISVSPKLGYFTLTPSFSMSDVRNYSQAGTPYRDSVYSLQFRSDRSQSANGTINAGVSTSTRFFGIFQPNLLGLTSVRHTVTPSLGINYSKQIYGQNIPHYAMTASFSMGNNFEMKYQPSDSAKEEKIQLLNLGANVSYDFARDSLNFSEIGVSYRTDIGRYLSVSGGSSYNLYVFDPNAGFNGARVNRFLLMEKGRLADLTSINVSLGTSFRGEKKQKTATTGVPEQVLAEQARVSGGPAAQQQQKKVYQTIYDREEADFSIPWNISLSYTFSQSQSDPRNKSRTSSLNATLSFNITDQWQVSTGASYDFVNKQHFIPSVDVTRDLHCWTMNFSWYPMGIRQGYRLELRVKAPQLQDLKVTKQGSQRSLYY